MEMQENQDTLKSGLEQPLENKYFTPSIEDIRVGYECEIHEKSYTLDVEDIKYCLYNLHNLRVPYLTKEQIEKEGWKCFVHNEETTTWAASKGKGLSFITDNTRILSIRDKGHRVLFRGECKDINTFRYICKLLGV